MILIYFFITAIGITEWFILYNCGVYDDEDDDLDENYDPYDDSSRYLKGLKGDIYAIGGKRRKTHKKKSHKKKSHKKKSHKKRHARKSKKSKKH